MNKYQLLEYYQDLGKIRKPFFVFDELTKRFLPKIHEHLVLFENDKFFLKIFSLEQNYDDS